MTRGSLREWPSLNGMRSNAIKHGFDSSEPSNIRGNWTILDERENEVVIATDICRSPPVYTFIEGRW